MQQYIVFLAILGSLCLYLGPIQNRTKSRASSADFYFTARNSVDSSQFAVAQIAYALQIATIYPFFQFAFSGQWWIAAVNTLGYTTGIILYRALLSRFSKGASVLLGVPRTMHAAIADLNDIPYLRRFTSILTIVGFSGLALFETIWGARALQVVIGGSSPMYYLIVITLALYLIVYVWVGGQSATIRADQYQLFLSYVGLHVLVAWVAWRESVNLGGVDIPIISPVIVTISALMFVYRLLTVPWRSSGYVLVSLHVFTLFSLGVMVLSIVWKSHEFVLSADIQTNRTALFEAWHAKDFPWIAASVFLLPLFFQFVDMTDWQRLASVNAQQQTRLSISLKGLLQYLIESPLSWLLPIFIGLGCARFLQVPPNGDPWRTMLDTVLADTGPASSIVAAAVFVGLIAVFLSTATELLNGIGYAAAEDLLLAQDNTGRERTAETGAQQPMTDASLPGKWGFTIATGSVVMLFIAADSFLPDAGGDKIVGLFMSFYSPLIALAPSLIIPAVTSRRAHPFAVQSSLWVGTALGLGCGIWSVVRPDDFGGLITWFASLTSFASAWLLYLFGMPFGQRISPVTISIAVGSVP